MTELSESHHERVYDYHKKSKNGPIAQLVRAPDS